ncbi:hypothetical protein PRIPAC_80669, partial [Pristionchus pacificus]
LFEGSFFELIRKFFIPERPKLLIHPAHKITIHFERIRCLVVCDSETRTLIITDRIGNWARYGKSIEREEIELELDTSPLHVVNHLEKYGWKVLSVQQGNDMGRERRSSHSRGPHGLFIKNTAHVQFTGSCEQPAGQ